MLLHNRGSHQQNKNATHWMGERIRWYVWFGNLFNLGVLVPQLRSNNVIISGAGARQQSPLILFFWISHNLFFYCCSSTVVSISPTTTLPCPTHSHLPPLILPPFGPVSFIPFPWQLFPLFPIIPLQPSLWLLSICSLFQCLWLYFACLFVLLSRFHL